MTGCLGPPGGLLSTGNFTRPVRAHQVPQPPSAAGGGGGSASPSSSRYLPLEVGPAAPGH